MSLARAKQRVFGTGVTCNPFSVRWTDDFSKKEKNPENQNNYFKYVIIRFSIQFHCG